MSGTALITNRRALVPASLVSLAMVIALAGPAGARTETLAWNEGYCFFKIRFDPDRIDRKALANTIEVLDQSKTASPEHRYADTPEEIASLDADGFEAGCSTKTARLRGLALLPIKGLERYRRDRVRLIEENCRFGSALMRGHRDPSHLRRFRPASPTCDHYVDALESKADLTPLWLDRVRASCERDENPGGCRERLEARGRGPDGEAWKRLLVTGTGWGYCAGDLAERRRESIRVGETGLKLSKAFIKAFRGEEYCGD